MHQVSNSLIQKPSEASLPTGLSSRMVFTCLKEYTKKEMQQRPYVAHVARNILCSFCSYKVFADPVAEQSLHTILHASS